MKLPWRCETSVRLLTGTAFCLTLCSLLLTAHAGMRGSGKYSGVVIFDRWDTCFLLSGPYMTYISETVKERLRPYAGQAIQIEVTDITQPMNPGDGLAMSYVILGQAPDDPNDPIANKIELKAEPAFDGKGAPEFDITVGNISSAVVPLNLSELGPTLLGINNGDFSASDGKSMAWITRADLALHGPEQTATSSWTSRLDGKTVFAKYEVTGPCSFKYRLELAPGESTSCRVRIYIPSGAYQFIAGYGGGVHAWKSIVSNTISFKVDDVGIAKVEP